MKRSACGAQRIPRSSCRCRFRMRCTATCWPVAAHCPGTSRVVAMACAKTHIRQWSPMRSEEHTSELQSLMRISYAVFCLKKKKKNEMLTTNARTHISINHKQLSCTHTQHNKSKNNK